MLANIQRQRIRSRRLSSFVGGRRVYVYPIFLFLFATKAKSLSADIAPSPTPQRDDSISLRDYTDMIARLQMEAIDQRFKSAAEAVRIANDAMEKRLEGMNEFRAQLTEQSKTYVTKESVELLRLRIEQNELWRANQEGRIWTVSAGMTLIGVLLALAARFFPAREKVERTVVIPTNPNTK